jgi:hypothetical protein
VQYVMEETRNAYKVSVGKLEGKEILMKTHMEE